MQISAVSSTISSTEAAENGGGEGRQQGVSSGAAAVAAAAENGAAAGAEGIVAKRKQVKTKVTERVKKDDAGKVLSRCWDVQVSSAVVRVYLTPSGDRELYTLSYWVDGKRVRQVFPSFDKAIVEAKKSGEQLNRGDKGAAEMSGAQRAACLRALELIGPTGVPIEVVAADFARFYFRVGRRATLDQVTTSFEKHNPEGMEPKRVVDVVTECLESKEQDKLSDRYLKQLEYDLNRFSTKFKNYIGDVAGRDIDKWLRDLGVSGRTRNNIRMSVQTLFGFAKAKRYLPKDHDEMDAVPVAKQESGAIEIFTPAELTELLSAASAEMIPFLTIGAFAGVRHAEIQRLDWKDVRFDAGIIEIHAGNAKTATRRTVPILPNLRTWLKVALAERQRAERHQVDGQKADSQEQSGPVCSFAKVTDQIVSLLTKINHRRKKEGREEFKWKHNGLRHSFISCRVAAVKNVAEVALEAGNSPQMIFSNYRELVTPQDAKAWFAIAPESVKAVAKGRGKKAGKGRRQGKVYRRSLRELRGGRGLEVEG